MRGILLVLTTLPAVIAIPGVGHAADDMETARLP
jgi:hypothetical protein